MPFRKREWSGWPPIRITACCALRIALREEE